MLDSILATCIKNLNVNMLSPSNFTSRNLPEMFIHIQRLCPRMFFAKLFVFIRNWECDKGPLIKDCFKVVEAIPSPGELLGCDAWGGAAGIQWVESRMLLTVLTDSPLHP